MLKNDRQALACRRIGNILERYNVANMRTLEQKISDAGPSGMRIDPHILTKAIRELLINGRVHKKQIAGCPWYYLSDTNSVTIKNRLQLLTSIYQDFNAPDQTNRIGQCLEIMVFRALREQETIGFLGGFAGLDEHDDSQLYSKEEPSSMINGKSIQPKKLDFLLNHPQAGWAGIEIKNKREWLYPDSEEIRTFLYKAATLDCVPILIARRIHYLTFFS